MKQINQGMVTQSPLVPNYRGKDTNPLNLDNPNPTTKE